MALNAAIAFQGIVALVTGAVYAYVARLILQRRLSDDARVANYAFATWWAAFGALEFFVGAYQLPNAAGFQDLATVIALIDIIFLLITVAFWGLLYYLTYLYTGSSKFLWPITAYYVLMALACFYLIAWLDPTGFDSSGQLVTTNHFDAAHGFGGWVIAFGLAFSVPIVIAALSYGSLFFRAHEPTQRFRIGVVSLSFILWFGWSTVSTILQLNVKLKGQTVGGVPVTTLISSTISLVVPILIVMAYRPPQWIRERLHVEAVA